jgi:hypothetical protein
MAQFVGEHAEIVLQRDLAPVELEEFAAPFALLKARALEEIGAELATEAEPKG